jgi:lipid-A-disaccharide synthase
MASLLVVAGDPSGDAHAARLIDALRARDPALAITALGGPAMERAGAALLDDLTQTTAIGPFDAARHLARFARAKRLLARSLAGRRPDLAILVDFGDFNLPVVAPLVKRHGIPVLYYISPQVWAWGRWRLRYVRRYVDRMVVFFPFEETFYQRERIPVTWVGHPLIDAARPSMSQDDALRRFSLNPWRRTVGLLPGSREHEVARHLPVMLAAAERIAWRMPGIQFLIPKAPAIPAAAIERDMRRSTADVRLADGSIADALMVLDAAAVASGTATLETALAEIPMVVVYKTSWPTYLAARVVVRVPRIAMVNVVAERAVVPELVQHRASPARIAEAVTGLLRDDERCEAMKEGLREVRRRLGPPGAVDRAARVVAEMLGDSHEFHVCPPASADPSDSGPFFPR